MKIARTVVVTDPLARANVMGALTGHGAPAGLTSCIERGDAIVLEYTAGTVMTALLDALIDVATAFVPERAGRIPDLAQAAAIAAHGLNEPELDSSRIIETYLR